MNRIKELRDEMGWTQKYLGSVLNVKNSAISKYETGRAALTEDTIIKMTKLFNVTSDYLLGLSDYRENHISSSPNALIQNEDSVFTTSINLSEESKILNYYNRLNDENKDYIKGQMINLYREQSIKANLPKNNPNTG